MTELLCQPSDLYDFGLPRGAIHNPPRRVGTVSVADNTIELESHGLSLNSLVSFRAGAGGSFISPLVEGVYYYATPVDFDTFRVSATSGGAAIDLMSEGAGVLALTPLPITAAIEYASEVVLDMLPAAVVPLAAPYPRIVSMTVAELAAAKLGHYSGGVSKSMAEMVDFAQKRLARWATGVPIRGANAPKAAALSSVVLPRADTRGWNRFGGIG